MITSATWTIYLADSLILGGSFAAMLLRFALWYIHR